MINRRFRVKLSHSGGLGGGAKSGLENCREVVSVLKNLIPIKVMDEANKVSQDRQQEPSGSSNEGESMSERAQVNMIYSLPV